MNTALLVIALAISLFAIAWAQKNMRDDGGGWGNFEESNEVHVMPLADLIPHAYQECICEPTTEPIPREDGSIGWLVTHNSMDGREARE